MHVRVQVKGARDTKGYQNAADNRVSFEALPCMQILLPTQRSPLAFLAQLGGHHNVFLAVCPYSYQSHLQCLEHVLNAHVLSATAWQTIDTWSEMLTTGCDLQEEVPSSNVRAALLRSLLVGGCGEASARDQPTHFKSGTSTESGSKDVDFHHDIV